MARFLYTIALLALVATAAGAAPAEPAPAAAADPAPGAFSDAPGLLAPLRAWAALLRLVLAGGEGARTVAELARQAPGNMSILIDALPRADLNPTIADPNFKATILAPTNRAFEAALLKLKLTPKQLYADKTALTNILSYHVIHDQVLRLGDLKDGQQLKTLTQHPITVKVDKGAGTMFVGASETAKIVAADIAAGQSVIHVVDTVLLPPTKPSQM
ncbi:hypothetical protein Rsub_06992 [Raphidocelis subcapitata]|uniref:FAS1 domain-containing protein n=1 Tax=Raphidocelis subcapitata TaxID=307507 RepID=A0A2V0P3M1_9CHLO|nr:hypothetical protein Rsub_06992 [Raphidocelis subcapitata]|eukprot:GBF94458.1 hypothetical protein Rsub_06992 [Raphidocelis subcapitata]